MPHGPIRHNAIWAAFAEFSEVTLPSSAQQIPIVKQHRALEILVSEHSGAVVMLCLKMGLYSQRQWTTFMYDLKPMIRQTGRMDPPLSPEFKRTLAKDNLPKTVGPDNRHEQVLRKQTSWQMSPPTSSTSPWSRLSLNAPRPPPSSQCQKVNSVLNQWLSPRTITPVTVQICSPAMSPVILS